MGIVTFSQDVLETSIYREFKVGDIWILSSIKQKLEEIYNDINYDKIAKAIDLLNYFEVQETMVRREVDGVKKRVKVYKILKRKV